MLSELHDKAPVHKWEASKAAIEKAFGLPVEQMFETIDHSAIASGSIAQVISRALAFTAHGSLCMDYCTSSEHEILCMEILCMNHYV